MRTSYPNHCLLRRFTLTPGLVLIGWLAFALPGWAQPPVPAVAPGELGKEVNPFIGTGGISYLCANNFPGASVPFGLVRLSPDTVSRSGKRATNFSGYYYSDPLILGFSHTRLVGTGATDGGNFLVIPTFSDRAESHIRGMQAPFSHQNETAFPGYYGVRLPSSGVTAELTATRLVGFHRYTFSRQAPPAILLNVTSILGNKGESRDGQVRILSDSSEVEGSVRSFGTFSKRYGGLPTYFVARFSRPFGKISVWNDGTHQPETVSASGKDLTVGVDFPAEENSQTIELKIAVSHVSIDNARDNLEREATQTSFDEALASAVSRWEETLSRIRIAGGTTQQRTVFLTALFRSFQMPTEFQDANGDYLGFDGKIHRVEGFGYYTDMSLWDTFRTVHPLYNLIARREHRDMVVSLLKMAEQGGHLPRWPSGGGYTNSMFGTPADIVISEAYLKGITDFDAEAALRFMKKTALGPAPPGSPFSGRDGIAHCLQHEYCPADLMKESVASTIEYSACDAAISEFAKALGHSDDAALFRRHATFYRNLWNPETKFFHPRDSQGKFLKEFSPEMLTYFDVTGKYTHAYVEGSAWQWRWGIPSDADHLVTLFGSPENFVRELNLFFEKSPRAISVNPNAFYWHGNQPDLYAPWLFNHAGRPDLTRKWVRWILDTKYTDRENGLDGNDDGGTLSAWYVLASLGIFPTPGTDRYELAAPLWDRAELRIDQQVLTITADNLAPDHASVRRILLNDVPLDRTWLRHSEIAQGGTLRFESD